MHNHLGGLLAIAALALIAAFASSSSHAVEPSNSQKAQACGSPDDVYNVYRRALNRRDWRTAFNCLTPEAKNRQAFDAYIGFLVHSSQRFGLIAVATKHGVDEQCVKAEYARRYGTATGIEYSTLHQGEFLRRFKIARLREVVLESLVDPAGFYEAVNNRILIHSLSSSFEELQELSISSDTAIGRAVIGLPRPFAKPGPSFALLADHRVQSIHFRQIDGQWLIERGE